MSRIGRYHDSIRIVGNMSRNSRNYDCVAIGCPNAFFGGGGDGDGHALLTRV